MGRGLGAILSAEAKVTVNSASDDGAEKLVGNIFEVDIDDIFPNPHQPRLFFDEKALNDLAQSIKTLGIIQPITLKKDGDKFLIISGERRYRACKIAGLKSIPAYVRLVNDQELLEMALVENIQREDLDAIEVALTYHRLIEEIGLTQEDLSQRVGKERSTITNSLRLLKLTPEIQDAIRRGEISAGHGRSLLGVADAELQQQIFDKIIKENLSVRQTEELVSKLKNAHTEVAKKTVKELPNHLKRAQKSISDVFEGLNVEIKSSGKGNKGKIILDFASEEELEKILKVLGQ
ncbi:ParB/RepB/Spo0J family partition protein [Elizabethkingia sp. JS20170427COW]|nr:ParB/RepB/Spo0J family partition protein [Elizabethkingia sp. JS20170427COW]